MKIRILILTLASTSLLSSGPLRLATFPVIHPVKTTKALGVMTKAVFKAGKAIQIDPHCFRKRLFTVLPPAARARVHAGAFMRELIREAA